MDRVSTPDERSEPSRFEGVARILGLEHVPKTQLGLAHAIEEGFDPRAAQALERLVGKPLVHKIVIDRKTLSRRLKSKAPLSTEESNRAARVAEIIDLARRVFRDEEKARRWLTTQKDVFSGRAPIEMIRSDPGYEYVKETLEAIRWGAAA